MHFEFRYDLPIDEARARLRALGEYLTNKHGIGATWDGTDKAKFNGRYKGLVKIAGSMVLEAGKVVFHGEDPGFLWRRKATDYVKGKLAAYLDPATPLERLARS